jgi:hypothetical protein
LSIKAVYMSLGIALCLAGSVREAGANAILNGGFETPGLVDWIVTPAVVGSDIFDGGRAHSGRSAAWFGAYGPTRDRLSQTFATSPGESYVLNFWLAHGSSGFANSFSVWWDGVLLLNLSNANRFGYREYTFNRTLSGLTSTLVFAGRDVSSYYRLDDVSVNAVTAPLVTPEPASLLLIGTGVAALLHRRRRRRA